MKQATFELLLEKIEMIYGCKPVIANDHKPRMVPTEGGEWIRKDQAINVITEVAND